jgi:hypothetical protein
VFVALYTPHPRLAVPVRNLHHTVHIEHTCIEKVCKSWECFAFWQF